MGLSWPDLIRGTLLKRYKRFLADVEMPDGKRVTAHCPNTGSMQGCCEPGRPVYVSYHANPKRKLKYTWELIEMPASLVGVNTSVPNRLVYQAAKENLLDALAGYRHVAKEVKVGSNSRLDLLLSNNEEERCFVEIKNCTLVTDRMAYFPDAVTARGLKHLIELQKLCTAGHRGVIFYLIQRMDAEIFKPARHIDPTYTKELIRAVKNGVEVLAYDVRITRQKISINRKIPVVLE